MRANQGYNLSITFLGTSGSWPTKDRNVSSTAVRRGGEIILFDCGEGTQRQFQRSDLSHMDVRKIFLTHFHGDHTYGIPGYLKTMQLHDRTEPLAIFGPPGVERVLQDFQRVAPIAPSFELTVTTVQPGETIAFPEGYTITAAEGIHGIRNFAYRLQEGPRPGRFDKPKALALGVPEGRMFGALQKGQPVRLDDDTEITPSQVLGSPRPGRSIVISGDTRPAPEIIELARDADVLIHEATYVDEHQDLAEEHGHSTAREAATVAKEAGVGVLYLHHFSPRYKEHADHMAQATEVFADVVCTEDLQTVDVPFPDHEDD